MGLMLNQKIYDYMIFINKKYNMLSSTCGRCSGSTCCGGRSTWTMKEKKDLKHFLTLVI